MLVCCHDAIGVSAAIKVNRPRKKQHVVIGPPPASNLSLFGFSVSYTPLLLLLLLLLLCVFPVCSQLHWGP